jgi:MFS family permease
MSDSTEVPDAPAPADKPLFTRGYTKYVLGMLVVVYVFNFIDRQILNILAPLIKADLGISNTQIGLLTGLAFGIFYATLGIPIARLADKYSRVNIISICLAIWSLMTALSGVVQNFISGNCWRPASASASAKQAAARLHIP